MIFDAKMSTKIWAEACNMSAYLMNRTPRALLGGCTPEEKWSGIKPDVSELKIFGSRVMVHSPKQKRTKWQPKSKSCSLLVSMRIKRDFDASMTKQTR